MKRLALVAVLAALPACTTFHEDRRTLTEWDLQLIKGNASRVHADGSDDVDGGSNSVIRWICVEPFAIAILPVAWLGDTLVLNPINGFEKAELQTYNRRFGHDDERGAGEAALKDGYAMAPWAPPAPVSDVLAVPEFTAHWLWNSIYPADPVNKQSWNTYWNEHHEQTAR